MKKLLNILLTGFIGVFFANNFEVTDIKAASVSQIEPPILEFQPLDTVIDVPLYRINHSETKELIDTLLTIDPYKYLVLSASTHPLYTDYVELKRVPLTAHNIGRIKGVYRNSLSDKPVLIMDLDNKELNTYSFEVTGDRTKLNINSSLKNNIRLDQLGTFTYILNDSSDMCVRIGYNWQHIYNFPDIAKRLPVADSVEFNETIKDYKEKVRRRKKVYRGMHKRSKSNDWTITFNATGDTITKTFAYGSVSVDKDITMMKSLPVYKFDESFYGSLTARFCDSLAINDVYTRHHITPKQTDGKASGITILGEFTQPEMYFFDAKGILLCNNGKHPILLYDVTPELLKRFGIIATDKTVVANFLLFNYMPIIDDTPPGYQLNLDKENDGLLSVNIVFGKQGLLEEEARPFQWIIDDYINYDL